jgi:glycerol-3-phosphate dehydrogenase
MPSRAAMLDRLRIQRRYDLIIIGGGITGCGIAWLAARAGARVLLLEERDLGAGTSSRSTKLIHGGIRYLKQLDLRLVREGVREREALIRLAPELVRPTEFVYPIYKAGADRLWALRVGLRLYDWFAGKQNLLPHQIRTAAELIAEEPLLNPDGLEGGAYYADCLTDDARLTLAVARAAAAHGAVILTYAGVTGFQYDLAGRIAGVTYRLAEGEELTASAPIVVNATGPWVDSVRRLDQPSAAPLLRLTKGVHLTVDRERLPLTRPVIHFGPDGRLMFAVPRGRRTYLGTTDTDWVGDPGAPTVEASDVAYILAAANHAFPTARLTADEIRSAWAGLRPLVAKGAGTGPSQISRDYRLVESATGLWTVAGGKLTAFRAMAEAVLHKIGLLARHRAGGAQERLPVDPFNFPEAPADGAALEQAAAWAVQEGFAHRLTDVMIRRTGQLLWAPDAGLPHADRVASLMADHLGWTADEKAAQVEAYRTAVAQMWKWRA